MGRVRAAVLVVALLGLAGAAPAWGAFADEEARNFAKTEERDRHLTKTPGFQARLNQANAASPAEVTAIVAADPARASMTQNLCHQHIDGCAGDVRFYDWDDRPGNVRRPVLWTARSGATISGHVWEVQGAGTAPKPGVVITNGSVQAPEQLYWLQAAELAKAGYVVLTWDPQTQGRSDRSGEPPTQDENATAQSVGAFTEGTQDALDFFESTPGSPFAPRNSRTNPAVNHIDQAEQPRGRGQERRLQPPLRQPRRLEARPRGQLAGGPRGVSDRLVGHPRGRRGGVGRAVGHLHPARARPGDVRRLRHRRGLRGRRDPGTLHLPAGSPGGQRRLEDLQRRRRAHRPDQHPRRAPTSSPR